METIANSEENVRVFAAPIDPEAFQKPIHPECEASEDMDPKTFQRLVASIKRIGLLLPVILTTESPQRVIDGRHRLRACEVAQVAPKFVTLLSIPSRAAAEALNDIRRHLSESQRAMMAARLADIRQGRPAHKGANLPLCSVQSAAEQMHVSERSVKAATKVQEDGIAPLTDLVQKGEVSVSAAAQVSQLPADDQRALVKRGPEAIVQKAAEIRDQKANGQAPKNGKHVKVSVVRKGLLPSIPLSERNPKKVGEVIVAGFGDPEFLLELAHYLAMRAGEIGEARHSGDCVPLSQAMSRGNGHKNGNGHGNGRSNGRRRR